MDDIFECGPHCQYKRREASKQTKLNPGTGSWVVKEKLDDKNIKLTYAAHLDKVIKVVSQGYQNPCILKMSLFSQNINYRLTSFLSFHDTYGQESILSRYSESQIINCLKMGNETSHCVNSSLYIRVSIGALHCLYLYVYIWL